MIEPKQYWKQGYTFFYEPSGLYSAVYFNGVLEASGRSGEMKDHLGADIHEANEVETWDFADEESGTAFGTVQEVIDNIRWENARRENYMAVTAKIADAQAVLARLKKERDEIYPERRGDVF